MIKPILFSRPMVQAILAGCKTMTRRVVKPQPTGGYPIYNPSAYVPDRGWYFNGGGVSKPKYNPGDILYVRETWMGDERGYIYKGAEKYLAGKPIWRPSIFMPREAARIFLRVTNVRCERLQEITDADAIHEGCSGAECDCLKLGRGWMGCESCMNTGWQEPPTVEFMQLWDCLNSKRGYGWNANPWVWVISFERRDKPEEF